VSPIRCRFKSGILAFACGFALSDSAYCAGITILSPRNGQEVKSLSVDVAFRLGSVFATSKPDVRFLVDGEEVPTKRGMKVVGDAAAPQQETVTIPAKNCEISLVAVAPDGTEQRASVSVKYAGRAQANSTKLYVLAVGVSDYRNDSLDLKLAAKDAEDFADAISRQKGNLYSDVVVTKLTNSEATREKIMDGLDWLSTSVTQHDRAMLFMAGHGDNDRGSFFFLPSDADVERMMATSVRWTDIKDTVSSMPCQTVVFLDACHSGGVSGRRAVPRDMNTVLEDWQTADSTAGSAMFSSSTGKQYSQEKEEWGNGAFTKALLEGLSGKAIEEPYGPVTLKKLDAFVSERVKEITSGAQSPTTSYTPDLPDIPLAFAGDVTAYQARIKEEQQLEAAKEQAATSINAAFRASQKLFHAKAKIEKLQALNSDGFANDAIAEIQKQVNEHQAVVDQNLAALNQLAGTDASIAVAQALVAREAQLQKDLETVAADQTAEVAKTAFQTLKQQINLPDHH
jgi:hypothetical protein